MITLVSYPRSGNTFLRNVLWEVYGISSKTYLIDGHGSDEGWQSSPVVKTHHLPHELPEELQERCIVYLVRDGRDSVVSFAHHRKDIVASSSDLIQNMTEAIYAAEGSHFGGWSEHVINWAPQAEVILHFEELVKDPIGCCERLRPFLKMPEPNESKLPTFEELKHGTPEYGSGKYSHNGELAKHWFRRGKIGAWKDEMPRELSRLFWHLHGEAMEFLGYSLDGSFKLSTRRAPAEKVRVLVEASKLIEPFVDGIGRYVHQLLIKAQEYPDPRLEIHLSTQDDLYRLDDPFIFRPAPQGALRWFEFAKRSAQSVLPKRVYHRLARWVRRPRPRLQHALDGEKEFDVGLLTLPQHAHFLEPYSLPALVAAIHDLTHSKYEEHHQANNVLLTQSGLNRIKAHSSSCLIAVSKSTQSDLASAGLKSKLVYEGVDRRTYYPIQNEHLKSLVRERYGLPSGDFLLSLGTREPRKNLQRLIDAYAQLDPPMRNEIALVLSGREGWKASLKVPDHCRERIFFTGYVAEEHLPALYTMARGFCYVSLYEGFGLPVLEAMACGCPVLVSEVSSLPELVGETGIQCDPMDTQSIASAIQDLLDLDRKAEGIRAMEQTWEFTWLRCWQKTADVIWEQSRVASTRTKQASSPLVD